MKRHGSRMLLQTPSRLTIRRPSGFVLSAAPDNPLEFVSSFYEHHPDSLNPQTGKWA